MDLVRTDSSDFCKNRNRGMTQACPRLPRFLLHDIVGSIKENYQKTLTKKKYNMLSLPLLVFKADKEGVSQ